MLSVDTTKNRAHKCPTVSTGSLSRPAPHSPIKGVRPARRVIRLGMCSLSRARALGVTGLALDKGMVHMLCTASWQTRGTFWGMGGPPSRRRSGLEQSQPASSPQQHR